MAAKIGKSARAKGHQAEREFIALLGEGKRNLQQTRDGGSDIELDLFSIEVKRQERPAFTAWVKQTLAQARGKIPVLAWRTNNHPWRIGVFMNINEFKEFIEWRRKSPVPPQKVPPIQTGQLRILSPRTLQAVTSLPRPSKPTKPS